MYAIRSYYAYCVALDEAENRLHVQKAVMMKLLGLGEENLEA